MLQTVALGVIAGYGVVSLLGGVMGYVKANSRASLIAGGVSGLVLLGSALLGMSQPVAGLAVACVVSVALVARFAKSAFGTKAKSKTSGVAWLMIGGGVAVLVTSALALL